MHHGETIDVTFNGWLEFHEYASEDVNSWPFLKGLDVGDVIAVKKVPAEEIKVGDVILFYVSRVQIVHRVVSIDEINGDPYYTTKGDANGKSGDAEINLPYSQIKGKVVGRVPYLGYPKYLVTLIWPF